MSTVRTPTAETGRRLSPAVRRAQIINEAMRQIAERGYNAFTLSRLATDCGITRAGIEHYFASKEELMVAVLQHRDELDVAASIGAAGGQADPGTARRSLDQLVRRNSQQREVVRLYTILGVESLDPTHPAHQYFSERTTTSRALLCSLAQSWHPRPGDFAVEVLAFMDGLQLGWLRDPTLDIEGLWAQFADWIFTSTP